MFFNFLSEIDKTSQITRWGLCLDHCPAEEEKPMCLSHPPIPEFGKSSDNTSSNFESNWFHVDFSTDDKSTYIISGEKQRLHWPDWIGKWGTEDFDASQKCIGKIKCQFLDSNEKLLKLFCDLALSCAEDDGFRELE